MSNCILCGKELVVISKEHSRCMRYHNSNIETISEDTFNNVEHEHSIYKFSDINDYYTQELFVSQQNATLQYLISTIHHRNETIFYLFGDGKQISRHKINCIINIDSLTIDNFIDKFHKLQLLF